MRAWHTGYLKKPRSFGAEEAGFFLFQMHPIAATLFI